MEIIGEIRKLWGNLIKVSDITQNHQQDMSLVETRIKYSIQLLVNGNQTQLLRHHRKMLCPQTVTWIHE